MLEILIANTVASPKLKKLQDCIKNSFHQKLPYAIVITVIVHFPKLQQKDLMTKIIRKKLATLNVNVYFSQLGKSWSEVKRILHYNSKPYIPETFQADFLEKKYNDPLARLFKVEKTLEFLTQKYYQSKRRADVEKYI